MIFLVPRHMPARDPRRGPTIAYSTLLASLPRLLLAHPELRLSAWIGLCVFAAFNAFWATLAFHLASPEFGLGPAYAGLFGLAAGPGAYLATFAGRLSDRLGPGRINLMALLSMSLAFAIFGLLGDSSLVAIAIGVNFLGFGSGSTQIANQTRIFRLPAEIRARLNTVYMVSAFSGGALGSFIAIAAFSAFGWLGVVATAGGFLALGLIGLGRAALKRRA
jgi:predicted MFS family arabinose efflux permease